MQDRTQRFTGWKAIGHALGVTDDTAQTYAKRNVDPLPVRYDHARRPYVLASATQDWIDRQDLPHGAYHALKARGALPEQQQRAPREEAGGPGIVDLRTRPKVRRR